MTRLAQPAGTVRHLASARAADQSWGAAALSSDAVDTANSRRTRATVVASATPHTKGAWVEVTAATTSDANVVDVTVVGVTATTSANSSTLLDIGTGASGSEVVVASNIAIGYRGSGSVDTAAYRLPVNIPSGSRVAVRIQGVEVSKSILVALSFGSVPAYRSSSLVTVGDNTSTSRGVDLTAPGSLNTKSAWTQIVASTSQPFVAVALGFQSAGSAALAATSGIVDVGVGAAAAETVIVRDVVVLQTAAETFSSAAPLLYPARIPAGVRVAARYARANANMTLDLIVYGVVP